MPVDLLAEFERRNSPVAPGGPAGPVDLLAEYERRQKVKVDPTKPVEEKGLFDAFAGGLTQTGRALGGTVDVLTDDKAGLVERANLETPRTEAQMRFGEAVRRNEDDDPDELGFGSGLWEAVKNVGGAIAEEPRGALHEMVAQLPNSGVVLGGMAAGAKAGAMLGAAAGPKGAVVGGIIGGIAGMFSGNFGVEAGNLGMSRAREEGEDVDTDEVTRQAAAKSGVITAVDTATLGFNRWLMGNPGKAASKVVTEQMDKLGLTPEQVLKSPDTMRLLREKAADAFVAAMPKGQQKAARMVLAGAVETAGEGTGEYLGSKAAGLDASLTEAVLESAMSLPQSAAEVGISAYLGRGNRDLNQFMGTMPDPGDRTDPRMGPPDPNAFMGPAAPADAAGRQNLEFGMGGYGVEEVDNIDVQGIPDAPQTPLQQLAGRLRERVQGLSAIAGLNPAAIQLDEQPVEEVGLAAPPRDPVSRAAPAEAFEQAERDAAAQKEQDLNRMSRDAMVEEQMPGLQAVAARAREKLPEVQRRRAELEQELARKKAERPTTEGIEVEEVVPPAPKNPAMAEALKKAGVTKEKVSNTPVEVSNEAAVEGVEAPAPEAEQTAAEPRTVDEIRQAMPGIMRRQAGFGDELPEPDAPPARPTLEADDDLPAYLKPDYPLMSPRAEDGEAAPVFRTRLETLLGERMGRGDNAAALKSKIEAWQRKGEIKAEELEYVPIQKFLEDKKGQRVTKDEVLQFIKENQPQIDETLRQSSTDVEAEDAERKQYADMMTDGTGRVEFDEDLGEYVFYNKDGGLLYESGSASIRHIYPDITTNPETVREFWYDFSQGMTNEEIYEMIGKENLPTKYDQYRTPGGDKYKELLITKGGSIKEGRAYTSGHWDEKNILAHVRFDERTNAQGEKVLFIDEVQSDWHQAGRKKGYIGDKTDTVYAVWRKPGEMGGETKLSVYPTRERAEEVLTNMGAAYEIREEQMAPRDAVPNAPFKKTWPMLAMKRMIRYAADNGFDRIAWTTGQMQADRYQLSNHIESVKVTSKPTYTGNFERVYTLKVRPKGGGGNQNFYEVADYKLAEYVGAELAQKIINDHTASDEELAAHITTKPKDRTSPEYEAWQERRVELISNRQATPELSTDYSGLDLKVGGEGMKAFYDSMLPNEINKYAKRYGVKVETTVIPGDRDAGWATGGEIMDWMNRPREDWAEASQEQRDEWMEAYRNRDVGGNEVPSFPVTPELRDAALEGQPMFAPRQRSAPRAEPGAPAITDVAEQQRVSTRRPTAVKAPENPVTEMLSSSYAAFRRVPDLVRKAALAIGNYPQVLLGRATKPETILNKAIEQFRDNLLWLYNKVDPKLRERSKLWYEGANRIANGMATRYGITPRQAAGVLATQSPQKDWFENVSLGERIIAIWQNYQDHAWDRRMDRVLDRVIGAEALAEIIGEDVVEGSRTEIIVKLARKKMASSRKDLSFDEARSEIEATLTRKQAAARRLADAVRGKKLSDIWDDEHRAVWIRVFDAAHNSPNYHVVSPEGDFVGIRKGKTGQPANIRWGTFGSIAKSVSVLRDGSFENISDLLGDMHKIRNFYNNIIDPNAPEQDVTIDTHAVAADMMSPFSGMSPPVSHNFGSTGKSALYGMSGTYPVHLEAYQQAAASAGVLGREMQSITWEAVRGLFTAPFKSRQTNVDAVNAIWERYSAGDITQEQARNEILTYVMRTTRRTEGEIFTPEWAGSPTSAQSDTSFEQTVPVPPTRRQPRQTTGINAEVAPNPDAVKRSTGLLRMWSDLPEAEQAKVTRNVAGPVIKVMMRKLGIKAYDVEYTLGGFEGETNPSVIIHFGPDVSYEAKLEASKILGVLWHQKAMITYDETDTTGGTQTQFVKVTPDRELGYNEKKELFVEINRRFPAAAGVTARDGSLVFGNFERLPEQEFHDGIDAALADIDVDYGATTTNDRFRSDWIEPVNLEGTRYESDTTGEATRGNLSRWQRDFGAIQSDSDARFRREVRWAHERSRAEGPNLSPRQADTGAARRDGGRAPEAGRGAKQEGALGRGRADREQPLLTGGIGGDGRSFTDFFAKVSSGVLGKPKPGVTYKPVIPDADARTADFTAEYVKHRGHFDDHIKFSIPGFGELQRIVGAALARVYGPEHRLLDIGASEGAFMKAVTQLSGMRSTAVDPNPAMAEHFAKTPVEGSEYRSEAFGTADQAGEVAWTEDDGTEIRYFDPAGQRYDVVHEAMVFQFISPERAAQIARVKELLTPNGVAIFEQKLLTPGDAWDQNEAKKNAHKLQYFDKESLDKKAVEILEGMNKNMVQPDQLEARLSENFTHVAQFWDSGNFKGYIASDDRAALDAMLREIGDTSSEYSTTDTPREVTDEGQQVEQEPALSPEQGPVPGPDATGDGRIRAASYGTGQEGSVSVQGTHYSREQREFLDSRRYGEGKRGLEQQRLSRPSADPAVRNRIYFYVDEGGGVTPEAGVGTYPHNVQLDNLYDWLADPEGLWAEAEAKYPNDLDDQANHVESAVHRMGFDGIYAPNAFTQQGVAVLLGEHVVPLDEAIERDKQIPTKSETRAQAIERELAQYKLPSGRLTALEWRRRLNAVGYDVEGYREALNAKRAELIYRADLARTLADAALEQPQSTRLTDIEQIVRLTDGLRLNPGSLEAVPPPNAAAARFLRTMERLLGRRIILVKNHNKDKRLHFNGVYNPRDPDTLFLAVDANRAAAAVIGHEFIHSLAKRDNAQFIELGNAILKAARISGDDVAEYKAFVNGNRGNLDELPHMKVLEEMVADIFGDVMNDRGFWQRLHRQNPGQFDQIIQTLKAFLERLLSGLRNNKQLEGSQYVKDVQAVHDVVSEFMSQYSNIETSQEIPRVVDRIMQNPAYYASEEATSELTAEGVSERKRRKAPTPEQVALDLEPPAAVSAARAQAADTFYTSFRSVPVSELNVGLDRVTNAAEAAHVLAPMRKYGQETFAVLVLDKDDRVLQVLRHSIGTIDGASVYPGVVAGAIAGVPESAKVWFAHNHPSGYAAPSSADEKITQRLFELMADVGVEIKGHIIVAPGGKAHMLDREGGDVGPVEPKAMPRRKTVPVTERMIRKRTPSQLATIDSPDAAALVVKQLGSENALLLLNNRHDPVAVLSLTQDEMLVLRSNGQVRRVLAAIDRSNAAAAIIKSGDEAAATNLARFLNTGKKVRVLDAFYPRGDELVSSALNNAGVESASGVYFSPMAPPAKQTETAAFRNWFGNSKVADANGEPLVVYHGTQSDISQFDPSRMGSVSTFLGTTEVKRFGIFAAEDPTLAEEFANQGGKRDGRIMPLYMSITNPLDMTTRSYSDALFNTIEDELGYYTARFVGNNWGSWELFDEDGGWEPQPFIDMLKEFGYDGVVINEYSEGDIENTKTWVAFDPTQIKSAVGNRGTFDPANPDILFSPREPLGERYTSPDPQLEVGAVVMTAETAANEVADALPDEAWDDFREAADKRLLAKDLLGIPGDTRVVHLEGLIVPDGARREGRGSAAAADIERWARDNGVRYIVLHASDPSAEESPVGFWKRQGYETKYEAPWGDEIMVKDLGETPMFAAQPQPPAGGQPAQTGQPPAAPRAPSFQEPDEISWLDKVRIKLYEKFQTLQNVQKILGPVGEQLDAMLRITLYPGRVRARIDDFEKAHLDPLKALLRQSDLSFAEIGEYLHARHAVEANRVLKQRNPTRPNNDRLSGMSNAEAAQVLQKHAGNYVLQQIVQRIDAINADRMQLLVAEDLLTPAEAASWQSNYRYYVPLHREESGTILPKRGAGFDVRGKESRLRAGSADRPVDHENMIARILTQYEFAVQRAEKNRVAQTLYRLAQANPNDGFWITDQVPQNPFLRADSTIGWRGDYMNQNVMAAKFGGETRYLTFNDQNAHANQIIRALKNLDVQSSKILTPLLIVNRGLAALNTSLSPEFVISNFFRDWQTAGYNLTDTELKDMKARVLRRVPSAVRGIRNALRGDNTHDFAPYFERFRQAGGMTGWMQAYDQIGSRLKALQMDMKTDGTPGISQLKKVFKAIEDYNVIIENGVRLSAFRAAVEEGMSDAQAARLAKELTVNFNRRGEWGVALNALYLFYNASIQGSVRLLRAVTDRNNKGLHKMLAATVGFAIAVELMNMLADEDDEYKNIPDQVKDRNLILMDPFELTELGYFKIPLPWGYNVFHIVGQEIAKAIGHTMGKAPSYSPFDSASRIGMNMLQAFNPVQDGSVLQTLAPTILDPAVRISENKDWHGGRLYPNYNEKQANYLKHFANARESSKDLARWLHEATLDPETLTATIDVSPEWIDMMVDFATGSVGRVIADSAGLLKASITGSEMPELKRYPMLRKVYATIGDSDRQRVFYEKFHEMLTVQQRLRDAPTPLDRAELIRNLGDRRMLLGPTKATNAQLTKLNKALKAARRAGNKEAEKLIKAQRAALMQRFMEQYYRVMYNDEG